MNTIPEGKEQIYVEALYKEPIDGIPFSNAGLTVGVSKYIKEDTENEVLDEQIQRLTKEYFSKLSSEIKSTRNDMIDTLRVELSKEYDGKLQLAKEEIIKLRKLLKDNGIQYK